MTKHKFSAIASALAMVFISIISCKSEHQKEYNDPTIFESAIAQFEQADLQNPPPKNAIIVIGSSSIRGWHSTIKNDFAPLTVIPRGFGGSNVNDVLFYANRIVLPYKPRAIVLYEGDNDVAQGISPSKIKDTFLEFIEIIYEELPDCRIYFLSIKPSVSRWEKWEQMSSVNKLIENECSTNPLLTYIDIATPMLNEQGTPKEEIFQLDNLHMNQVGYAIWVDILKPILMRNELKLE